MPSAAARRLYEDQIPSFMSILDPESESYDDRTGVVTMVDTKMLDMEPTCAPQFPGPNQAPQLQQHLSAMPADAMHRHNSESADSSPTTTLTTDTSSLSDPSPSSSPDSPVNLIPLNNYPGTSFGGLSNTMDTLTVNDPTPSGPFQRPMTSPSPRRRNMKGLSIQPPFASSLSSNLVSEPSSPSFIKPTIPGMKRKPSQLSLKTDGPALNIRPTTIEVPPSPGVPILQRRALKHSTSSPQMLYGIKSATFGPAGGMGFPTLSERGKSGLSEVLRPSKLSSSSGNNRSSIIMEEDSSPIRTQQASCAAMDFEPFRDESEANEDQKSPGYPDGPIAIYDDNVYLYLEPTAHEAAKFDVVINVAREVHNPFSSPFFRAPTPESPIPDTAATTDSFATAFEYPMEDRVDTPTTPKAANSGGEPEYIHMPWDHNTDIATDLMMLCETIEKRTRDGKRVLVHCQQGASRSASLIIAYGLYQNPGMSVNDAYYRAQSKSRWISPNMKLMYCLQDFQKEIAKRRLPRSAAGSRSGRSPTKHRLTLSADNIDIKPKEPLSAPLPEESPKEAQSAIPDRSGHHARVKSSPNLESISPGPSSAPSSFLWAEKEADRDGGKPGRFNFGSFLEPSSEAAFPPTSSSFFQPPPSPGLKPPKTSLGFTTKTTPLGFQSIPSLGFQPPPTPRFPPAALDLRPPPSPGFPPPSMDFKPPPSPGFPPSSGELKRPISSGFGARRFGKKSQLGVSSLGFGSMDTAMGGLDNEPVQQPPAPATRTLLEEDALMSPREQTMTTNPLHESLSDMGGMKFVEVPPTPNEGLFSPRETMFPRNPFSPFGRPIRVADPRSPPTRGETPIVRSIDELL